jgi:hypothetical protein
MAPPYSSCSRLLFERDAVEAAERRSEVGTGLHIDRQREGTALGLHHQAAGEAAVTGAVGDLLLDVVGMHGAGAARQQAVAVDGAGRGAGVGDALAVEGFEELVVGAGEERGAFLADDDLAAAVVAALLHQHHVADVALHETAAVRLIGDLSRLEAGTLREVGFLLRALQVLKVGHDGTHGRGLGVRGTADEQDPKRTGLRPARMDLHLAGVADQAGGEDEEGSHQIVDAGRHAVGQRGERGRERAEDVDREGGRQGVL